MKKEDLYRSINALDGVLIEQSEADSLNGNRQRITGEWKAEKCRTEKYETGRWITAAICAVCAAALIAVINYGAGRLLHNTGSPGNMYGSGINAGQPSDFESRQKESPADTKFDSTPILYSDLKLNDNAADKEIIKVFAGAAADIKSFDENMLADCAGIVEGEITNIYLKQYSYQIFDNKFEDNGVLNAKGQTVVYEIKADKVWYGEDFENKTFLIEDQMFFPEEMFALKKGHRYVIPFYDAGTEIYSGPNYAGGDIRRDSVYSTVYQFHPQIEVTKENCYILSNDWKKLSSKEARPIIIDSDVSAEDSFYKDKMVLVTAEVFEEQMNSLINEFCN